MLKKDALKEAAVRLCEFDGVDPEQLVSYPDPNGFAVCRKKKAWMLAAEELHRHAEIAAILQTLMESRT